MRHRPGAIRYIRILCCLLALAAAGAPTAGMADAPVLVIGAEDDWLPYSGIVDGKPAGLAVDLVSATLRAAGIAFRLESLPYSRCMALTRSGQIAGCFDTSRDNSLENDYLWHDTPLFRARILIFARRENSAAERMLGVADLHGKRVAITNGYTYGDEFDLATDIDRQPVTNDLTSLRMLAVGRTDYALVFEKVEAWLRGQHRREFAGHIRPAGFVKEMPLYVSFSRNWPGSAQAVADFNRGARLIAANGTRAAIEAAWQRRLQAGDGH